MYLQNPGATESCTNIMIEAKKGIGQKYIKGAMKRFIFGSWFSSNNSAEYVMEIYAKLIDVFKTNTKGFFKQIIDNLTKYWTVGSYIVLRRNNMVPWGSPLIAIGYNYNARKFIYFIVTDNAGVTQAGLTYLSKYSNQFLMFPFALLLVHFSSIISLDLLMRLTPTTNQGSLILNWESYGLLSFCWIMLCTTVYIVMAITNCCKLIRYGVKK